MLWTAYDNKEKTSQGVFGWDSNPRPPAYWCRHLNQVDYWACWCQEANLNPTSVGITRDVCGWQL